MVKQSDLIGDIEGFPIEIVQKMVEHAEEQGNRGKKAIKVFQKRWSSDYSLGGFDWNRVDSLKTSYWVNLSPISKYKNKETMLREFYKVYPKQMFPRIMEVSNFEHYSDYWNKRVVFMEKNGYYIAWGDAESLEESEKVVSTTSWRYAREVSPKVKEIELTLDEIAEKFNIPVNKLKIKK